MEDKQESLFSFSAGDSKFPACLLVSGRQMRKRDKKRHTEQKREQNRDSLRCLVKVAEVATVV